MTVAALYCYDCASAVAPEQLMCPECHGTQIGAGVARPCVPLRVIEPDPWLLWPWDMLHRWPPASVVLVSGGPGSGKSSLAALLRPDYWLTTEESVSQAREALERMQATEAGEWPDAPTIYELPSDDLEAFEITLAKCLHGLLVLDSGTRVGGIQEQHEALKMLIEWAKAGQQWDRRVLVILHLTKTGKAAGKLTLGHECQAELSVGLAPGGLRMLQISKNRHGSVGVSRYFTLGAKGAGQPTFEGAAYSVEGEPGCYRLHPWPIKGAEWAGYLDKLFKGDGGKVHAVAGVASAARPVPGYPDGVLRPGDVALRRAYAESHGLKWLDPGEG